jgi:hypothetical protein
MAMDLRLQIIHVTKTMVLTDTSLLLSTNSIYYININAYPYYTHPVINKGTGSSPQHSAAFETCPPIGCNGNTFYYISSIG